MIILINSAGFYPQWNDQLYIKYDFKFWNILENLTKNRIFGEILPEYEYLAGIFTICT